MATKGSEKDLYQGKKILVTGGTGSIGSEIVRQLLETDPAVIRILSRDETKQYYLHEELGERANLRYLIGDVRDLERLRWAFDDIDIVFHAAALKHVPSCEYNPFEAVQTNVVGTQNVLKASIAAGVEKLIAISTDKAVGPMNTMGATKLLAEKLIMAANLWAKGIALASVRFGNVLGSRGSLVPLLVKQIREQGCVKVTDPEMTRFMMSIGDAVKLVLRAGVRAQGGGTFILRMPAVKIGEFIDVVTEMVAERDGLDKGSIKTVVIGLRPGEKLHEELLTAEELTCTTLAEDMLMVNKANFGKADTVDPSLFDSRKAPHLDRTAIREMIIRSGALDMC